MRNQCIINNDCVIKKKKLLICILNICNYCGKTAKHEIRLLPTKLFNYLHFNALPSKKVSFGNQKHQHPFPVEFFVHFKNFVITALKSHTRTTFHFVLLKKLIYRNQNYIKETIAT